MKYSMRIGVDAGGTFTDFVVLHDDGHVVHVRAGTLEADALEPVDLLLGNITIATLLELRSALARHARPGGLAILSGVLAERAEARPAGQLQGWKRRRNADCYRAARSAIPSGC